MRALCGRPCARPPSAHHPPRPRSEQWPKQAALKESKDGQTKMISSMKAKLSELKTRNIEVEDVHDELKALEDMDELGDL